jgi:hypothetical protein
MREFTIRFVPLVRLVRLAVLAGVAGLGLALACGSDDLPGDRPEPPPNEVDAGSSDAGTVSCPSGPPKVGEVCPRPDNVEDTCHYALGTCVVEGTEYARSADYRCSGGVWIRWGEPGPCDAP